MAPAWAADPASVRGEIDRALTYPLFVKPANLGSSLGISKVKTPAALDTAIAAALQYDRKVIVENGVVEAREIECAVIGNDAPDASVPGEIVPAHEFYDYDAKYLDSGSRLEIPAAIDAATTAAIQAQAIAAFRAIDAAGLARVDFLLSRSTGTLFVNEINTLPGFTTISMFSKLWAASGVAYPTLVDRLIALAVDRHRGRQALRTTPGA
jgi:D-alanine-D-alanine ligase